MTSRDPNTCRRALREIGEIAAVAILPDSQMTDQQALQSIAPIAEWVRSEAPSDPAVGCGHVIYRLHELTAGKDLDALEDDEALALFAEVIAALETSDLFEA